MIKLEVAFEIQLFAMIVKIMWMRMHSITRAQIMLSLFENYAQCKYAKGRVSKAKNTFEMCFSI